MAPMDDVTRSEIKRLDGRIDNLKDDKSEIWRQFNDHREKNVEEHGEIKHSVNTLLIKLLSGLGGLLILQTVVEKFFG